MTIRFNATLLSDGAGGSVEPCVLHDDGRVSLGDRDAGTLTSAEADGEALLISTEQGRSTCVWEVYPAMDSMGATELAAALRQQHDTTAFTVLLMRAGTMYACLALAAFAATMLGNVLLPGVGTQLAVRVALTALCPALLLLALRARLQLRGDTLNLRARSMPLSDLALVEQHGKSVRFVPRAGGVMEVSALGPLAARFIVARWKRHLTRD